MILEDLYRGKYAPIENMAVHNDHDILRIQFIIYSSNIMNLKGNMFHGSFPFLENSFQSFTKGQEFFRLGDDMYFYSTVVSCSCKC